MAKKTIVTVGFSLPHEEISWAEMPTRQSLIEYDVILFRPNLSEIYCSEDYEGYPCYSSHASRQVRELIPHWKNQIVSAANAGRTVIIFLCQKNHFYHYTGTKEFSGTGRNRATTNHVAMLSNYDLIPPILGNVTQVTGTRIESTGQGTSIYRMLANLKGLLSYKAHFDGERSKPILKVAGTDKTVGAVLELEKGGRIAVLPDFSFDWSDLWIENAEEAESEDEGEWSPEAFSRSQQVIDAALAFSEAGTGDRDAPPPVWTDDSEYRLPAETAALTSIANVERELQKQQENLEEAQRILSEARSWKQLLFSQGPALENTVRQFFGLAGIEATRVAEGDMEFDVVFEFQGVRCLGEVEGKDNKQISVEKISQLKRCLDEDYSRDEIESYPKGILFGNAFRTLNPGDRKDFFTDKVLISAERSGITLVETTGLFAMAQAYFRSGDRDALLAQIEAMVRHTGGLFRPTL